MPIIDMPLDQLLEYRGKNECPADFDAYWDKGIQEMENLGTSCRLQEAKLQLPDVKCYELFFTGVGNAEIHGRFVIPLHPKKKVPCVCVFHGYAASCGPFTPLLSWAAAGFAAVSMSCRGQGGLSQDSIPVRGNTLHGHIIRGLDDPDPDKLYFRNVFLDTAQLARIVAAMPDIDETRIGATGGSQGGGLTLACAALTPFLNRAFPMMSFLCDYRRVWEMDLDVAAYAELREYFRCFDPRHEREKEIFTKLGYIDNQHLAHRIRAEIKMCTGLLDTICPPSTQFAVYNKIVSPKSYVLYPDYGHEFCPDTEDICLSFMLGMKSK